MRSMLIASAGIALFAACHPGPHPGFKEVAPGLHFRLLGLGASDTALADGDSVLMRFRAGSVGGLPGALASTERWYLFGELRRAGAWGAALARLHAGDSASIILRASGVPWPVLLPDATIALPDTQRVQVEIGVMQALPPDRQMARAEARRMADPHSAEQREMAAFLASSGLAWTRWGTSDLYYILGPGATDTLRAHAGDRVTVAYTGRRLSGGEPFDASERQGGPLSFRFGDTDQVLYGIEVAVSLLRAGQRGMFLLPSSMAFGEGGSPGIVGPYEPVLYEVHLLRVEHAGRDGG